MVISRTDDPRKKDALLTTKHKSKHFRFSLRPTYKNTQKKRPTTRHCLLQCPRSKSVQRTFVQTPVQAKTERRDILRFKERSRVLSSFLRRSEWRSLLDHELASNFFHYITSVYCVNSKTHNLRNLRIFLVHEVI